MFTEAQLILAKLWNQPYMFVNTGIDTKCGPYAQGNFIQPYKGVKLSFSVKQA